MNTPDSGNSESKDSQKDDQRREVYRAIREEYLHSPLTTITEIDDSLVYTNSTHSSNSKDRTIDMKQLEEDRRELKQLAAHTGGGFMRYGQSADGAVYGQRTNPKGLTSQGNPNNQQQWNQHHSIHQYGGEYGAPLSHGPGKSHQHMYDNRAGQGPGNAALTYTPDQPYGQGYGGSAMDHVELHHGGRQGQNVFHQPAPTYQQHYPDQQAYFYPPPSQPPMKHQRFVGDQDFFQHGGDVRLEGNHYVDQPPPQRYSVHPPNDLQMGQMVDYPEDGDNAGEGQEDAEFYRFSDAPGHHEDREPSLEEQYEELEITLDDGDEGFGTGSYYDDDDDGGGGGGGGGGEEPGGYGGGGAGGVAAGGWGGEDLGPPHERAAWLGALRGAERRRLDQAPRAQRLARRAGSPLGPLADLDDRGFLDGARAPVDSSREPSPMPQDPREEYGGAPEGAGRGPGPGPGAGAGHGPLSPEEANRRRRRALDLRRREARLQKRQQRIQEYREELQTQEEGRGGGDGGDGERWPAEGRGRAAGPPAPGRPPSRREVRTPHGRRAAQGRPQVPSWAAAAAAAAGGADGAPRRPLSASGPAGGRGYVTAGLGPGARPEGPAGGGAGGGAAAAAAAAGGARTALVRPASAMGVLGRDGGGAAAAEAPRRGRGAAAAAGGRPGAGAPPPRPRPASHSLPRGYAAGRSMDRTYPSASKDAAGGALGGGGGGGGPRPASPRRRPLSAKRPSSGRGAGRARRPMSATAALTHPGSEWGEAADGGGPPAAAAAGGGLPREEDEDSDTVLGIVADEDEEDSTVDEEWERALQSQYRPAASVEELPPAGAVLAAAAVAPAPPEAGEEWSGGGGGGGGGPGLAALGAGGYVEVPDGVPVPGYGAPYAPAAAAALGPYPPLAAPAGEEAEPLPEKVEAAAATLRDMVLQRQAASGRSLRALFGHFDRRRCGYFDAADLDEALRDLCLPLLPQEVRRLLRLLALDRQERVAFAEFAVFATDPHWPQLQARVAGQLAAQALAHGRAYRLLDPFLAAHASSSAPSAASSAHRGGGGGGGGGSDPAKLHRDPAARQGVLDKERFLGALAALGLRLSATEAQRLLVRFDVHGAGRPSYHRFVRAVERAPAWRAAQARLAEQEEVSEEAELVRLQARRSAGRYPEDLPEEVLAMCEYLGIRPLSDRHCAWIAAEALAAGPPDGWAVARDRDGRRYYHHRASGASRWDHPLDNHFRELYFEHRGRGPPRRMETWRDREEGGGEGEGEGAGGPPPGARGGGGGGGGRAGGGGRRPQRLGAAQRYAQVAAAGGGPGSGPGAGAAAAAAAGAPAPASPARLPPARLRPQARDFTTNRAMETFYQRRANGTVPQSAHRPSARDLGVEEDERTPGGGGGNGGQGERPSTAATHRRVRRPTSAQAELPSSPEIHQQGLFGDAGTHAKVGDRGGGQRRPLSAAAALQRRYGVGNKSATPRGSGSGANVGVEQPGQQHRFADPHALYGAAVENLLNDEEEAYELAASEREEGDVEGMEGEESEQEGSEENSGDSFIDEYLAMHANHPQEGDRKAEPAKGSGETSNKKRADDGADSSKSGSSETDYALNSVGPHKTPSITVVKQQQHARGDGPASDGLRASRSAKRRPQSAGPARAGSTRGMSPIRANARADSTHLLRRARSAAEEGVSSSKGGAQSAVGGASSGGGRVRARQLEQHVAALESRLAELELSQSPGESTGGGGDGGVYEDRHAAREEGLRQRQSAHDRRVRQDFMPYYTGGTSSGGAAVPHSSSQKKGSDKKAGKKKRPGSAVSSLGASNHHLQQQQYPADNFGAAVVVSSQEKGYRDAKGVSGTKKAPSGKARGGIVLI